MSGVYVTPASVFITPLERNVSEEGIECPGDIIPYNCSIQSNSEMVHLIWRVTLPGQISQAVIYNGIENLDNRSSLNSYISTYLTAFKSNEFILSTLEITVVSDIPANGIMLECLIDALGNDSTFVFINTSSK